MWRSRTTICSAPNLFSASPSHLFHAHFLAKLGPNKPGQVIGGSPNKSGKRSTPAASHYAYTANTGRIVARFRFTVPQKGMRCVPAETYLRPNQPAGAGPQRSYWTRAFRCLPCKHAGYREFGGELGGPTPERRARQCKPMGSCVRSRMVPGLSAIQPHAEAGGRAMDARIL